MAAITDGKAVRIWNLQKSMQLQTVIRSPTLSGVQCICFSPDSRRLATGMWNEKTRIWDTETGRELLAIERDEKGAHEQVLTVAFSPDGRFLVTRALRGPIRFWPTFSWKEEDYPGDETMSLTDRIELYKRAHWKERTRLPEWALQTLETTYVTDWWVIGPFDNTDEYQFSYPYPPEKKVDLTATYAGMGQEVRWERLAESGLGQEARQGGFVRLHLLYEPDDYVAAYAMTYMYSPVDRNLRFLIGSDDSVRFWLNGELVWSNPATRGAWPDQDDVDPVFVPRGWNKILLRVSDNNAGDWGFYFRATDDDYHELYDLKFDPMRGERERSLR